MFEYFLYNFHPLFHSKVLEISFSNSWLFSLADDPLLQETPSELMEHRSSVGIGEHVELHPPVREAIVVIHHAVEVLDGVKGPGHTLCRWLYWMLWSNMVEYVVVSRFPCDFSYRISILLFGITSIISSLLFAFIFLYTHNFNFFI